MVRRPARGAASAGPLPDRLLPLAARRRGGRAPAFARMRSPSAHAARSSGSSAPASSSSGADRRLRRRGARRDRAQPRALVRFSRHLARRPPRRPRRRRALDRLALMHFSRGHPGAYLGIEAVTVLGLAGIAVGSVARRVLPRARLHVASRRPRRPSRRIRRARPGRRRAARAGRGTASSTRSRARGRGRTRPTARSPPCSPQIPSFRSPLHARAPARPRSASARRPRRRRASRTGSSREDVGLEVVREEPASASSREKPSVVCVRSFVPKEKKSACSAISSARTHARGSSIIVPTRYSISRAACSSSADGRSSVSSRRRRSSSAKPTSGCMISTSGASPVRSSTASAARDDRAHLHLVDLREHEPEAAAARAEHRVRLGERADAAPPSSATPPPRAGQELVQRRVEQPDRHRQPGHRLEDPLEVGLLDAAAASRAPRAAPPSSTP